LQPSLISLGFSFNNKSIRPDIYFTGVSRTNNLWIVMGE
jgi:hypothetical protein